MNVSRSLVDNWILELAFSMWNEDYEQRFLDHWETSFSYDNERYREFHRAEKWQIETEKETVTALAQTLDLLVINDELIYDHKYSFTWKRIPQSKLLRPILKEVKLSSQLRQEIYNATGHSAVISDRSDLVWQGAIYYLALARFLGLYYWPSPKRAEYLRNRYYDGLSGNFALKLRDYLDGNLKQITKEILEPIGLESPPTFPGFSGTILASCNSASSIIPTLIQIRESSSGRMFREWLRNMDKALQNGNLEHIAKEMKSVRDLLAEVKRGLGLSQAREQTVEFQIGISPTLTLSDKAIGGIIDRFKPKPYHLVFLRNNFDEYLQKGDVKRHLSRLFPYIK